MVEQIGPVKMWVSSGFRSLRAGTAILTCSAVFDFEKSLRDGFVCLALKQNC